MKFLIFILFLFLHCRKSHSETPLFSSFPLGPISNYGQSSTTILLKCSNPIHILINDSIYPLISLNISQVSQWFASIKPIQLTADSTTTIPQLLAFTNFDLSLNLTTPLGLSQFIVVVSENCFFSSTGEPVPFSSPLIISRGTNSYTNIPISKNPLGMVKYGQKYHSGWEDSSVDVSLKDYSVHSNENGVPFLDIRISTPKSGLGNINIDNLVINMGGIEYISEKLTISVSKNDPMYNVPVNFVSSLNVFQEFASKNSILNPSPGDTVPTSRDDFFSDVLKVQAGDLVCVEDPTRFSNFVYSDINNLEKSLQLSFRFRVPDSIDVFVEYIWDGLSWFKIPLLNRGYSCQFQDIRNQYCPYCNNVYHRLSKTGFEYLVYKSTTENIIDFGLKVLVGGTSLYYNNENDNFLGNRELSLKFNLPQNITNEINNKYILIPNDKPNDSTYFIYLDEITNGCNGVNITYNDFYSQSSCRQSQYSCSNIHYFRDPQAQTLAINSNLNYLFGNTRSGINFDKEKSILSIERLQPKLDFIISMYVASLPFLQPFIKETQFKMEQTSTAVTIYYSFLNYGGKSGEFSIGMNCNNTGSGLTTLGTIESNNSTKEFTFSFTKSIVKAIKYYECETTVEIKSQEYWSKVDKVINSKIYFQIAPEQVIDKCDQKFENTSIIVSRKQYIVGEKVTFIAKVENNIDFIDWFSISVICQGSKDYSTVIQIPQKSYQSIPITIDYNHSNTTCQVSVKSFQSNCVYNIVSANWDYSKPQPLPSTSSTSSESSNPNSSSILSPFFILIILLIIILNI